MRWLGNYTISERMKDDFADFEAKFGPKVFIIFSINGEIANSAILPHITSEINRLQALSIELT